MLRSPKVAAALLVAALSTAGAPPRRASPLVDAPPRRDAVDSVLATLSVRERAAQLVMAWLPGGGAASGRAERFVALGVGGVIVGKGERAATTRLVVHHGPRHPREGPGGDACRGMRAPWSIHDDACLATQTTAKDRQNATMSRISRIGRGWPRFATASIARPSCSVVVTALGATRRSSGTSGPSTA